MPICHRTSQKSTPGKPQCPEHRCRLWHRPRKDTDIHSIVAEMKKYRNFIFFEMLISDHQIVSPISNSESTNVLTNIYCDFFFNWQTEKKKLCWTYKKFVFISTAQTEQQLQ